MKKIGLLFATLPVITVASEMVDEYIALARLREVSSDSFELIFDLNSNLAAQCEYTVPARKLMMNTDYFSFPAGIHQSWRQKHVLLQGHVADSLQ